MKRIQNKKLNWIYIAKMCNSAMTKESLKTGEWRSAVIPWEGQHCCYKSSSFIHPSGYNSPTKTWTAIYEIQVKTDNERQLNICLGKQKCLCLRLRKNHLLPLLPRHVKAADPLCCFNSISKRVLHLSAMGWAPEPLKRSHPHMWGYSTNYFILCPCTFVWLPLE